MPVVTYGSMGIQVACGSTSMLYSVSFKHIVIIFSAVLLGTCSVPINNGFSLKFNPISPKEDVRLKTFGAVFAKVPQGETPMTTQEEFPNAIFPKESGCSNQITRIFPSRAFYDNNSTKPWDKMNFLNVPIVDQPFDSYNILVATAPKHIKISGDEEGQPLVIYIIFPDDTEVNSKTIKMPSIYFVNKVEGKTDLKRKAKSDPIFIIDSNRTVTGLKSTEVSKFIKFRNKLRNHFLFSVVPGSKT